MSSSTPPEPAPAAAMPEGWYPCPSGAAQLRYWTGTDWTGETRPDLLAWVHGPRRLDLPGVFGYGRPDGPPARERPGPPDRQLVRRALNYLLIAVPIGIVLWLSTFYGLFAIIGVSRQTRTWLFLLLYIPGVAYLGRWHQLIWWAWQRFRPLPARQPAPPPARTDVWADLRNAGYDKAARRLDGEIARGSVTDVDYVRIARMVHQAHRDPARLAPVAKQIERSGAAAWLHPSGQRDLPARLTQHDLVTGQVRLGVAAPTPKNPPSHRGLWFALDTEVLRTSMLVIGPPGAGKTRGFARPVVELLGLQTLVNRASVVVIDANGSDLDLPGVYDIDIDATKPDEPWGFDLFGGAAAPDEAADRLAGALLDDDAPAADAARNALDSVLGAYHTLQGHYPTLRELIDLLADTAALGALRVEAEVAGDREALRRVAVRERQLAEGTAGRADPAAPVIERLRLLDRPSLVELFDGKPLRFAMRDIDKPLRVRVALPESTHPQAARILARLAIAQFVQVVAAPNADRSVFKGLVVDGAGRFVDSYVVQGLQRARAANAGLVLLVQSMREFPEELRASVFANTGCKAVFAGVDPQDATYVADWWGKNWVAETTVTTGTSTQQNRDRLRTLTGSQSVTYQHSVATRAIERYRWSPSEVINDIPVGHALITLATPDGIRTGPILVNLRG